MTTTLVRNTRRALLGLGVCLLLLLLAAGSLLVYLQHQLNSVDRIEGVFDGLGQRPDRPASGPGAHALNILLLGTDRRSEVATTGTLAAGDAWVPGAQRTDAMMLVHVDGDRGGVTVISLPRDSWVEVPGYGSAKINAAFSYGGLSLAVHTVEQLTDVRIDHVAVVDWAGFSDITDAVGGIDVTVPKTVHDSARDITWTAGEHHLDGDQALDYVGQRYGLPAGDLDRVRRQQAVLSTLAQETLAARSDPALGLDLVRTLAQHVSVDEGWKSRDMVDLAWSLRHVGGGNVRTLTVPVRGLGWEGDQSVVHLDRAAGAELWQAVRTDGLDAWSADHHASPGSHTDVAAIVP